jgi:hypothetical protein
MTDTTADGFGATAPDDHLLVRRLISGDPSAADRVRSRAAVAATPELLVATAVVVGRPSPWLGRAAACATSTRDRQLVAIGAAFLAADSDRLDALVRDHLADHPDSLLAAWIAALARATTRSAIARPTDPQ